MPCRKENYILLEQSVTVDSKEVDALVTKIGEALQLHNNSANPKAMSCLHSLATSGGAVNSKQTNNTAAAHRRNGCCIRFRSRGLRSRASPYNIPGASDQEWDHFKPWSRRRLDVADDEDHPHQFLQELLLSGNLIKEAVRRLQFASEPEHEISKPIDYQQC